jgi:L-alanine-DL-glutamate epimerase-like enolase superfamily enzyme
MGRWGGVRAAAAPNVASVEKGVASAEPFLIGRDPWDGEAIFRTFQDRAMGLPGPTGYFAFAGIDQALWDLRGKAARTAGLPSARRRYAR